MDSRLDIGSIIKAIKENTLADVSVDELLKLATMNDSVLMLQLLAERIDRDYSAVAENLFLLALNEKKFKAFFWLWQQLVVKLANPKTVLLRAYELAQQDPELDRVLADRRLFLQLRMLDPAFDNEEIFYHFECANEETKINLAAWAVWNNDRDKLFALFFDGKSETLKLDFWQKVNKVSKVIAAKMKPYLLKEADEVVTKEGFFKAPPANTSLPKVISDGNEKKSSDDEASYYAVKGR